jgi:glycosyltransferase involved in cell wall biosynthesis
VPGVTVKLGVVAIAGPDNGGTYQYTLATLQALRHSTGFEITVYGDPQNPDLAEFGFPISPFAERRSQQLAALAAYRLRIRLPDAFEPEDILLAPVYAVALLHTAKPFAYTLHDMQHYYYPENFSWATRAWRQAIYRSLSQRMPSVICESKFVKSDIVRILGVPEGDVTVMPAPPQRQFLNDPGEDLVRKVRDRLQLPKRFLFYPAQFWPHKNHLRLIEAFRGVVDEMPDMSLVLTGKRHRGDYDAVKLAIERFGLSERVHLLDYVEQDDLRAIYRLAAALVMPSLFESVSIPIYEAFQAGTPVVASDLLAIPDQVADAGLLFDPRSVSSITDAVLKVFCDPEATRQRVKVGHDRMLAMTTERYGEQLERLLHDLKRSRSKAAIKA